jgi:hypothetical protein
MSADKYDVQKLVDQLDEIDSLIPDPLPGQCRHCGQFRTDTTDGERYRNLRALAVANGFVLDEATFDAACDEYIESGGVE